MIIHRFIRSVISNANRIKMTWYRFIEICFPFPESFFNSTVATSFLVITSKDAVFVIYNRSYQVSFLVSIYHPLLFYHRTRFRSQFIPDNRQHFLQFHHFIQFYRCSGISLNATFTFTGIQVTKKFLLKYIKRYNYIINLNHKTYVRQKGRSSTPPSQL